MSSETYAPCRFGYEEHDGSRYCWLCDRYPVAVGVPVGRDEQ